MASEMHQMCALSNLDVALNWGRFEGVEQPACILIRHNAIPLPLIKASGVCTNAGSYPSSPCRACRMSLKGPEGTFTLAGFRARLFGSLSRYRSANSSSDCGI